jgi:hypothetical protein
MADGRRLIWRVECWCTCLHDPLRGYDGLRFSVAPLDGMAGRLQYDSGVSVNLEVLWSFCFKLLTMYLK